MNSTDPYGQGGEAALDDEEADDIADFHENPYPENTLGWDKWNKGYAGMMQLLKERENLCSQ